MNAERKKALEDALSAVRQCKITADQKFDNVFSQAQRGVKNLSLAGALAFGMLHMAESIETAIRALERKPE